MEIDSKDVVRLMIQFMKENGLVESMKVLQTEAGVSLNTVDNVESFAADIINGRWDTVLSQVSQLSLAKDKMVSFIFLASVIQLR